MIARILVLLTGLYIALVCIGVALVSALQAQLGFLPALGVAVLMFVALAAGIGWLLLQRLRRMRSFMNLAGMMEIMRNRRP